MNIEHAEQAKHLADAVVLPSGAVAIASHHYWNLHFMNEALTFIVLLTSAIWGVYRVFDIIRNWRKGD